MTTKGPILSIPQEPSDAHLSEYALIGVIHGKKATTWQVSHLRVCDACNSNLQSLRQRAATFAASDSTGSLFARLDHAVLSVPIRDKPPGQAWWRPIAWIAPMAVAIALVLALRHASVPRQAIALKGSAVTWVVRRGEQQLLAPSGFAFRAADRIGIRFIHSEATWVTVFSVSAAGNVRIHFPEAGSSNSPVAAGTKTDLPFSLKVESPVELELICVLLSPQPVMPQSLRQAVTTQLASLRRVGKGIEAMQSLDIDGVFESRLVTPQK